MGGQCEKSSFARSEINREIRYETTCDATALLDAGANPLIKDKTGRRALDLLFRRTNFIPEHYEEALRRLEEATAKAIEAQTTGEGAQTG